MSENSQEKKQTEDCVQHGITKGETDSKLETQELRNDVNSSNASQEQKVQHENDNVSKELLQVEGESFPKELMAGSNDKRDIQGRGDGEQGETEILVNNEFEMEESDQKEEEEHADGVIAAEGDKQLSKNAQKKLKRTQMWTVIKQRKKEQKKQEKLIKRQEKQTQENNVEKSELQLSQLPQQQDDNHSTDCIKDSGIAQNQEPMNHSMKSTNENNNNNNNSHECNDTHNEQSKSIPNAVPHREPYKSTLELREQYSARMKNGQAVILDMQFLDLLEPKEFKSLVKQLCYMQSSNKKAATPSRFMITSANAKLKQALLANNGDKWGIEVFDQHYLEIFEKQNIVYLSGDTEDDLEELEKGVAYVIGGLVDHNRLKNVTLDAANQQGLKVKRFPIQRYLKMETSSILACNHVFDIIVQRINGVGWRETLLGCIPQRKIVATIDENGREIPTEHHLKKMELMKKQQEEALIKKKLKENNNSIEAVTKQGQEGQEIQENEDIDQDEEEVC